MADEKLTQLPPIPDPVVDSDLVYLVRAAVSYQGTIAQVHASITPGAAVWGDITGTLSSQTDLVLALDSKISGVAWGDITGTLGNQNDLLVALDAKVDAGSVVGGGLTMNQGVLLGRGAGLGVGPIGEITVGAG
jgi:hypothetical protein